jgi:hypothetical protein
MDPDPYQNVTDPEHCYFYDQNHSQFGVCQIKFWLRIRYPEPPLFPVIGKRPTVKFRRLLRIYQKCSSLLFFRRGRNGKLKKNSLPVFGEVLLFISVHCFFNVI